MKKLFFAAAALLLSVTCVLAQTPEEKQASAGRIAELKQDVPKNCGVKEIDDAVAQCKSVADATVAVTDMTTMLSGDASVADPEELLAKIQTATENLVEAGKMLGTATGALKNLKNPMKLKSAKKSLDYAQAVIKAAGEELPYQGKVVAAMVSGK